MESLTPNNHSLQLTHGFSGVVFHLLNRGVARMQLERNALKAIRRCIRHIRPYGDEAWTTSIAHKFGLESTPPRTAGRPRKQAPKHQ